MAKHRSVSRKRDENNSEQDENIGVGYLKRLNLEMKNFEDSSSGIVQFSPIDDSKQSFRARIQAPKNTPYENRFLDLEVTLPCNGEKSYPLFPPKIKFLSRIFHPNISSKGDICLDTLSSKWTPALTIKTTLVSIISLLSDPNIDDFLVPEAAFLYKENREEYLRRARETTEPLDQTLMNSSLIVPNGSLSLIHKSPSVAHVGPSSGGREKRFEALEPLQEKVFENGESKDILPIIDQCIRYKLENIPTCLQDLVASKELRSIIRGIESDEIPKNLETERALLVEKLFEMIDWPIEGIAEGCLQIYTKEIYFYKALNTFLRRADESKVPIYASFVRIIWFYFNDPDSREIHSIQVYRRMKLEREMLEKYKKAAGSGISFRWPAFSSTSQQPNLFLNDVNTVFVIQLNKIYPHQKKAIDIKHISEIKSEEEVLLKPGIEFSIRECQQNEGSNEYSITVDAYV